MKLPYYWNYCLRDKPFQIALMSFLSSLYNCSIIYKFLFQFCIYRRIGFYFAILVYKHIVPMLQSSRVIPLLSVTCKKTFVKKSAKTSILDHNHNHTCKSLFSITLSGYCLCKQSEPILQSSRDIPLLAVNCKAVFIPLFQVIVYVNKVGPYFNPHETYHYYQLPVCRPQKVSQLSCFFVIFYLLQINTSVGHSQIFDPRWFFKW